MGLTLNLNLVLFHLLALCAPFLETASCTCNGYITERGQGECKTTYKVFKRIKVNHVFDIF